MASVSHEGSLRTTGEVRLAYGPTLDPFPRCLVVQRYGGLRKLTTNLKNRFDAQNQALRDSKIIYKYEI